VIADLHTLLIALYVELADRIIASLGLAPSGPGQPPEVTDAELVCLAVAQVLLRYDDERHWLRVARSRVGHLFPRLLGQSGDKRLKNTAPLMQAALRWLADQTPGSAEMLRLRPSRNGVLGPMARHSEHVHRLHSGHGDPGRVARRTLCSPGGRRLRAGGEPLAVLLAAVGSSRPPRRARAPERATRRVRSGDPAWKPICG